MKMRVLRQSLIRTDTVLPRDNIRAQRHARTHLHREKPLQRLWEKAATRQERTVLREPWAASTVLLGFQTPQLRGHCFCCSSHFICSTARATTAKHHHTHSGKGLAGSCLPTAQNPRCKYWLNTYESKPLQKHVHTTLITDLLFTKRWKQPRYYTISMRIDKQWLHATQHYPAKSHRKYGTMKELQW